MGIDDYFYTVPFSYVPEGEVTVFKFEEFAYNYKCEHIYFREKWEVHSFMSELYNEKSGEEDSGNFNCVPLILTLEDIERIEGAIQSQDIHIIQSKFDEIKKQIQSGKIVAFYYSWWKF